MSEPITYQAHRCENCGNLFDKNRHYLELEKLNVVSHDVTPIHKRSTTVVQQSNKVFCSTACIVIYINQKIKPS